MDAPYMGRFDPRLDFAKLFLPTVHTNGVPLRNSYSLGTIERLTHISHLLEDDIASIPQEAWAFLMAEVAHLPVKILTALQKNEPKMLHIQKRFQEAYRTILSEPGRAVDPLRMRLLLNIMKR